MWRPQKEVAMLAEIYPRIHARYESLRLLADDVKSFETPVEKV